MQDACWASCVCPECVCTTVARDEEGSITAFSISTTGRGIFLALTCSMAHNEMQQGFQKVRQSEAADSHVQFGQVRRLVWLLCSRQHILQLLSMKGSMLWPQHAGSRGRVRFTVAWMSASTLLQCQQLHTHQASPLGPVCVEHLAHPSLERCRRSQMHCYCGSPSEGTEMSHLCSAPPQQPQQQRQLQQQQDQQQ